MMPLPSLAGVLAVLKSRWFHYAALLLACLLLWQRATGAERSAKGWQLALEKQRDATIATAAAAKAKAIAQRLRDENEFARAAMEADHEIQVLRSSYADRTDAYARAHRVRPAEGAAIGGGGAGASGTGSAASGYDGPGGQAELVAISRGDLDRCTEVTARLVSNVNFGLDLIERGLAIPEVEFGQGEAKGQ